MNAIPITIKETFNEPFFQEDFELVAGKEGLDNFIHSVSVMEVSDFINFDLGDNLFVLTTFSFCKTGNCDMIDTFEVLAKKNIAGILVKLNRYYDDLPDTFFEIAEKYNIPVFTTKSDIPFREIISVISKNIINSQMDTILMMNDMYKNLYGSLINNHSTERYIELLKIPAEINFYVKLEGTVVYESNSDGEFEISEMTRKIEHIDIDAKDAIETHDNYYEVQNKGKELLVFPIGGINHSSGKVIIDKTKRKISHLHIMAFTQLASYLSIKLTEYKLTQEERINNNSRIYNDIIENPNVTHEKALNLLHLGGYGNYPAYQLLYVSINITSNSAFEILKNKYVSLFNQENEKKFISLHTNGFNIIYGKKNYHQKDDESFERFINTLQDILNRGNLPYKIGISKNFDDYGKIPQAHEQAKRTTVISSKIKEFNDLMYYEDVWEVDMLRALSNSNQIKELEGNIIDPLIEYDQTHQLDLLGTLGECIQTDTLKDIANNLFIHTTTLRYRLDRIETITGYNFLTNKGKFVLTCAYFVHMLNH